MGPRFDSPDGLIKGKIWINSKSVSKGFDNYTHSISSCRSTFQDRARDGIGNFDNQPTYQINLIHAQDHNPYHQHFRVGHPYPHFGE